MLINTRTKPVVPDVLAKAMGDVIPGHSDLPHAGLDVSEGSLGSHPTARPSQAKGFWAGGVGGGLL